MGSLSHANRDVELAALAFVTKFSGSLAEVWWVKDCWDAADLEPACCSEGAIGSVLDYIEMNI